MRGYKMIPLQLLSSYALLHFLPLDRNMTGFCILLSETRTHTYFMYVMSPVLK